MYINLLTDSYNLIPVLKDNSDELVAMLFGKEFHSLTESTKKGVIISLFIGDSSVLCPVKFVCVLFEIFAFDFFHTCILYV